MRFLIRQIAFIFPDLGSTFLQVLMRAHFPAVHLPKVPLPLPLVDGDIKSVISFTEQIMNGSKIMGGSFVITRSPLTRSRLSRAEARAELNRITREKTTFFSAMKRLLVIPLGMIARRQKKNPRIYFEAHRVIGYMNDLRLYRRRFIFRANGSQSVVKEMYAKYKRGDCVELAHYSDADVASYLKMIVREEIDGLLSVEISRKLAKLDREAREKAASIVRVIVFMQSPEKGLLFEDLVGLMAKIYEHRKENQMDGLSVASIFVPMLLGKSRFSSLAKEGQEKTFKIISVWGEIIRGIACGIRRY